MNIAFFGTSDKSQPILDALGSNVKLCVTKADTIVGRKHENRETGVKIWAKSHNVPYLEIDKISDKTDLVINELIKHKINVGVMADFSFIVPEKIINCIPNKIINIHFSLLPLLRGASPVPHAILNGFGKTGVTFYIMNKGMDTGPIIAQFEIHLSGKETTESLNRTLFALAAEKVNLVLDEFLSGKLAAIPQENSLATYCYSKTYPKSTLIDKNDAKIDWSVDISSIEKGIRAYYPWPISWTILGEMAIALNLKVKPEINKDLRIKIYEAELSEDNKILHIKKLQVEGKKITEWESFCNGYLN